MKKLILFMAVLILFAFAAAEVPAFTGAPSVDLGEPKFTIDLGESDVVYLPLDGQNRVTGAAAIISASAEPRESTSAICPTGWQPDAYEFIPGRVLYNRSHLIAHQFGGAEVAENLFTGTQFINRVGMAAVENAVAEYIGRTGDRVRYEVVPVFDGENQVCAGVFIRAASVEDGGLHLSVFCHNVQPGVMIDYATGLSALAATATVIEAPESRSAATKQTEPTVTFILNTHTRRFHLPSCPSVDDMNPTNRQDYFGTYKHLIEMGYTPCGRCHPERTNHP